MKKNVKQPLEVNQIQLSIMNASMVANGMNVNMPTELAIDRDGDVLDYCRLHDITIQAWSPFQSVNGVFLNNEKYPESNSKIMEIADKYQVSNTVIAIAWLMRIPAKIQPIIGSMNIWKIKRKGTKVHRMSEVLVGIVSIVVTVISIIVTVISIWQNAEKEEHQKSNRSDQS